MDQDHQLVMDHDHPPPTEDEQQRMAELWAMEEVNAPRGWDDEEELDYTVLSQRQAEHPGVSPERKGSGEYLTEVDVHTFDSYSDHIGKAWVKGFVDVRNSLFHVHA